MSLMKHLLLICFVAVVLTGVFACASSFDAASIHHTFGVGRTTKVVHDSTVINSSINH